MPFLCSLFHTRKFDTLLVVTIILHSKSKCENMKNDIYNHQMYLGTKTALPVEPFDVESSHLDGREQSVHHDRYVAFSGRELT